MRDDPIVEVTREVRDELAARFNYDVRALGVRFMARQDKEPGQFVSRKPKTSGLQARQLAEHG